MGPFTKAEEKMLYSGLVKVFKELKEKIINGNRTEETVREAVREFLSSPEVDAKLRTTLSRTINSLRKRTASNWREAAFQSSNGRLIYELLQKEMQGPLGVKVNEIISENAAYIKTVPQEWARFVSRYAARKAMEGERAEEIEAELRKIMPQHMTKNLKCIARTEVAKANAALTEARAEAVGIKAYIWRCVHDERTRLSHRAMDGTLIFYNNPPNPEADSANRIRGSHKPGTPYGNYHAGNTFNCRCFQAPVIDASFLPTKFKIIENGRSIDISRKDFIKKYGEKLK